MADDPGDHLTLTSFDRGRSLRLPTITVSVTHPEAGTIEARLGLHPLVIGSSPDCGLMIRDPRVSRRHCELRLTKSGILLRDLGSKNGTLIGKVTIVEALVPPGVVVTVGDSELVAKPSGEASVVPLSPAGRFGEAIGQSLPMRALFAKLERAALTDETILLLGESGTGKEVLARAIHDSSLRRDGPFVVFDCSAITPTLVESELFGHVRGAFTGATNSHPGLFEEANGGTLMIDEIGELPLDLQPKLLRALEARKARRVGSSEWRPFDVRVVAATHRNLRAKVAEGSFREDLYYRLAVVDVAIPALRERRDDIPALVERFLAAQSPPRKLEDLPPHALALFESHGWPGNVRELRNMVTRLLLFPDLASELISPEAQAAARAPVKAQAAALAPTPEVERPRDRRLLDLPLPEAREFVIDEFERSYLSRKLEEHKGNISRAAEAMGVSRQLVHRLVDRHNLRSK